MNRYIDFNWRLDKLNEECGVFGIYDNDGHDCARLTYYGLYALQHRGQESCGIAVNDDGTIIYHKDMGLVPEVFNDVILNHLKGQIAVGHVRYSTTGASLRENAQPLVTKYVKGTLTVAHNGNLVNAAEIRSELEKSGAIFQTTIDSEVIAYLIARERVRCGSIEDAVAQMMKQVRGSYSLVVMSPRKLIGARDPYGIRPLSIGKLENSYILASETCALDSINAEFVRDVEPGEVVVIDKNGLRSLKSNCIGRSNLCIFEFIYFARPDSIIEGASVYETRKEAGRILAKEHPVEADLVIGVPDSGVSAAVGYAEESGIPYGEGLIKNRYIGRTFIQPEQSQREKGVKIKLNVLKSSVEGKRIVMVDDSIVRGTTSGRIVQMLKDAGAKEVHMRISSPPFKWPCYFGTDIPSRKQLVASTHSIEEIRQIVGADSLGYLSIEGLSKMAIGARCGFCKACFSGEYPMEVPVEEDKMKFGRG
ncbi:MAG: amidophosphoribosyltransferase [Petroclostridium sp.]|jgi:amidophosphoribosyltransferase|uniref:amidophosphoribosyltransferase n=1 Tax=Petroclostridium xylanilyticum TaxID=1792311 RepID=UPI000B985121|nr:amidophosphoribosyltransferase [Petroclostridium xylanilyticum]MBZ4647063.1 amidophosphoribosyltransferase [Clostridia bacterium]MDK2810714.1 amidophosphoribosyltransferase [Petroclostridium sp.]